MYSLRSSIFQRTTVMVCELYLNVFCITRVIHRARSTYQGSKRVRSSYRCFKRARPIYRCSKRQDGAGQSVPFIEVSHLAKSHLLSFDCIPFWRICEVKSFTTYDIFVMCHMGWVQRPSHTHTSLFSFISDSAIAIHGLSTGLLLFPVSRVCSAQYFQAG